MHGVRVKPTVTLPAQSIEHRSFVLLISKLQVSVIDCREVRFDTALAVRSLNPTHRFVQIEQENTATIPSVFDLSSTKILTRVAYM